MIARGDAYADIRQTIQDKHDRAISAGVITAIKKRNPNALATIKEAIIHKEQDDALGLLERSRRLLGKTLRDAEKGEYHLKPNELIGIAKEMFHQTRTENEDEAAKLSSSDNPQEKLKALQDLLAENDEVRLERIIFAKREQTTDGLPQADAAGTDGRDSSRNGLQRQSLPPVDNTDGPEVHTGSPGPETPAA